MRLDIYRTDSIKIESDSFERREQAIHERIKFLYGKKLGREITDDETKEIADNLLQFAKEIYGI